MNDERVWLPHDLLWGLTPSQLPTDAPAWVVQALSLAQPVVVRRAVSDSGAVAVGVRGAARDQRYATFMPEAAIVRAVRPEQLTDRTSANRDWPALQALRQLRPLLDACGLAWGVSGSAGFELASGFSALHQDSDLDLIARTPEPLSRARAAQLLALLQVDCCRVDMQLQTPAGAVALAEWAGPARQVLLKTAEGPQLVLDPWCNKELAA